MSNRRSDILENEGFSFRAIAVIGTICLSLIAIWFGSCTMVGPPMVEKTREIQANETAYLIQLEGDTATNQDIFRSVEFLNKAKIAAKRVILPQRKQSIGRWPSDYRWVETVKVITVNRTPETRVWTVSKDTGTTPQNEAIAVESKESIGFSVGVTITARVLEEDASLFLYNFSGTSLEKIMDYNVKSQVQSVLSREFGSRYLQEAYNDKATIFDIVLKEVSKKYKAQGVTIDYMGYTEGLIFDNPAIQESIDRVFKAEMDVKAAKFEKLAQDERNNQVLATAETARKAAQEFAKAQKPAVEKIKLEIDMIRAEAMKIAAGRWNGGMPSSVLPAGSGMLFGLDGGK